MNIISLRNLNIRNFGTFERSLFFSSLPLNMPKMARLFVYRTVLYLKLLECFKSTV